MPNRRFLNVYSDPACSKNYWWIGQCGNRFGRVTQLLLSLRQQKRRILLYGRLKVIESRNDPCKCRKLKYCKSAQSRNSIYVASAGRRSAYACKLESRNSNNLLTETKVGIMRIVSTEDRGTTGPRTGRTKGPRPLQTRTTALKTTPPKHSKRTATQTLALDCSRRSSTCGVEEPRARLSPTLCGFASYPDVSNS